MDDVLQSLFPHFPGEVITDHSLLVRKDRLDSLISLLIETAAPGSLHETGGGVSMIRPWSSHLVIQQTIENHRKIDRVLANARRVAVARARGETPDP